MTPATLKQWCQTMNKVTSMSRLFCRPKLWCDDHGNLVTWMWCLYIIFKGELHPKPKLTCFARNLKNINTFLKNNISILKQIDAHKHAKFRGCSSPMMVMKHYTCTIMPKMQRLNIIHIQVQGRIQDLQKEGAECRNWGEIGWYSPKQAEFAWFSCQKKNKQTNKQTNGGGDGTGSTHTWIRPWSFCNYKVVILKHLSPDITNDWKSTISLYYLKSRNNLKITSLSYQLNLWFTWLIVIAISLVIVTIFLTGGNWQKWKRVFLTCPCHKIYRDEAVGLKSCKYTWKITEFVKMGNLGQYRENLIFCQ